MRIKIKNALCCIGIVMIAGCLCSCGNSSKTLSILDQAGAVVAELPEKYSFEEAKLTYCDVAVNEAVQILSERFQCSESKAREMLWDDEYQIYTYYDEEAQTALTQNGKKYIDAFDCGGAITDLKGNLVAAYGHSAQEIDINYALHTAPPYSSLKPLSVYAQAIEKGLVDWSKVYEDSPYKQIELSDGSVRDWPMNADGQYRNADVTVYEAIKKSLNTVAVKCLKDVGVNTSVEFLQKNFSIPLSSEQYTATIYGEEEIIGNVAMGYLKEGVSPVDMAGYYQIFVTGGEYIRPAAVQKICDKEGKEFYTREYNAKDVISPITSDLMNKLLQGVTKTGGTGVEANCGDVEVAGKTGSADANAECWFVGLTPEYSCAIWHGKNYKNLAPVIFSRTMKAIYEKKTDLKKTFAMHSSLEKFIYCEESGKSISSGCTSIQMGYYVSGTELQMCDKH